LRILTLARDLRRRKARDRNALFVVEGVRASEELIKSPLEIIGALASPQLASNPRGATLRSALASRGAEITDVTSTEFDSAAETETPQGILVVAATPKHSLKTFAATDPSRLLVLDAVQDPGNVGTLIRTAAGLGATATVALPGTVDLWNAKVVRSAMGAHFHHLAFHSTWEQVAAFLEQEHVPLWVADASGEPLRGDAPSRLALAVGNEGGGLSPHVRDAAARVISLPVAPVVESLNVAVAAGILLYELRT